MSALADIAIWLPIGLVISGSLALACILLIPTRHNRHDRRT